MRRAPLWGWVAGLWLVLPGNAAWAQMPPEDLPELKWHSGFQFTPGFGFRHFALDVVRNSDGYRGNISNTGAASMFASLAIETPSFQFPDSNWGVSAYAYAANVDLDSQWVGDGGTNPNGTSSGSGSNVGTNVSGYYSYLVPALHYRLPHPGGGEGKVALGYGKWIARLKGDIILTANDRPYSGLPHTSIDTSTTRNAYLFLLQWKFVSGWQVYMSVGGPTWRADGLDFQAEEVSTVFGYTFTL
jgi:hypothetical protein